MSSLTRETVTLRNVRSNAVAAALIGGTLRIYSELSTPPPFEGSPGQLLVTIALPASFSQSVNGVVSVDLLETTITNTGEANWYRAYSSTGVLLLDGPCYLSSDPSPPVGGVALTVTALLQNLTITGTYSYTSPQQD